MRLIMLMKTTRRLMRLVRGQVPKKIGRFTKEKRDYMLIALGTLVGGTYRPPKGVTN